MKQIVIRVLLSALILTLGFSIGIFASLYVDQNFMSVLLYNEGIDMMQGFLIMLIWIPFFMIVPSILCVKRAEKRIILWGILGFFFSYFIYFICLSGWLIKRIGKSSPHHAPNQLPLKRAIKKITKILVYISVASIILCIFGMVLWFVFKTIDDVSIASEDKGKIAIDQFIIIVGGPALLGLLAFFCGLLMKNK